MPKKPKAKAKPVKAPKWQQPVSKGAATAKSEAAVPAKAKPARPQPADLDTPNKPRGKALEPAWHGWPKQERFCLYFHNAESDDLLAYIKFGACYAAKKFVEAVAGDEPITMLKNGDMVLGNRVVVRSPNKEKFGAASKVLASMQEVYDHKYTPAEAEWTLPCPYDGKAAILGGRKSPTMERLEAEAAAGPQPVRVKEPRAPRAPRPAGSGSSDPLAIRDDMPWDQKVRRMAKKLCAEANGGDIALWRNYKAAGERRLKEASK